MKHIRRFVVIVLLLTQSAYLLPTMAKDSPFADVDTYNFSRTAILYLQQEGIITGEDDGLFYPSDAITRAEFVALLLRSKREILPKVDKDFGDVSATSWYAPAMKTALDKGIIKGYGDGTYHPAATITKAEATVMLQRWFDITSTSVSELGQQDIEPQAWYYDAMRSFVALNIDPFIDSDHAYPSMTLTRGQAAELLFRTMVASQVKGKFEPSLVKEDASTISILSSSLGADAFGLSQEEQQRISMLATASQAVVSVVGAQNKNDLEAYVSSLASYSGDTPTKASFDVTHGTGFFITRSGLIVTNGHVVEEDIAYRVLLPDGRSYPVKNIYRDSLLDIALLEMDAPKTQVYPYLDLWPAETAVQVGQDAYTIGNTLGRYATSIGSGIITGLHRTLQTVGSVGGVLRLFDALQTDAEVSRGNSGGPLLSSSGRVLGVVTALDEEGENLGFAIPSLYLAPLVKSFLTHGEIRKPYMGIRYVTLDKSMAETYGLSNENGAYILSAGSTPAVAPGSPAEKAGIQERDIIVSVNGTKLTNHVALSDALSLYRNGETVTLQIIRNGTSMVVTVPLDSKPAQDANE